MLAGVFEHLAEASGTPIDYVKLFTLFLISYPLAVPLAYLPAQVKHAANIAVTTFYLYGVLALKTSYVQVLVNCLATYVLTRFNVGGGKGNRMPWIVFLFQMAHLTVNHCVRSFGNIPLTTIEITAMQMVLCMNLTSFAWSVHDGKNRKEDQCDDQQRSMRITGADFPSLLEFLGYAFYFPGVLVGPSTRFVDYRAWSKGTLYGTKDKLPPSGRFTTGLIELLSGFTYMGVWATLSPKYSYEAFVGQNGEKAAALALGPLNRIRYAFIVGIITRAKYYGIWTLTNGACIISGLSYNGMKPVKSGQGAASVARWDRCKNINVSGVEFANNWKELLDNWNMNTNVWLRNNVYKRVARPGKKPGFKSTMLTFLTSAFWHGVAPGYYMTFVLGGFYQSVGRSARAHLRPLAFKDPRKPNPTFSTVTTYSVAQLTYCALSVFFTQLTMSFAVLPFMLLDIRASWQGWTNLYHYGIILAAFPLIAFRAGLGRQLDQVTGVAAAKKREKEAKAAEASKKTTNSDPRVVDVDATAREAQKVGHEVEGLISETVKKSQ